MSQYVVSRPKYDPEHAEYDHERRCLDTLLLTGYSVEQLAVDRRPVFVPWQCVCRLLSCIHLEPG